MMNATLKGKACEKSPCVRFLPAAAVALAGGTLLAGSGTWTGAEDGFWTNANNWAEGTVPGRYYAPDGSLVGSRDSVATFGAVADGAATVIDFDGVRAISNLIVTAANAPAYTFGTSADQAVPLDDRGMFWVKSDAAHVPTMVGFLVLGRDNADTKSDGTPAYGALNSYIVNDAAEELVLNGFGYLDMGNAWRVTPYFEGSGDIRLCGPYRKGPNGTSSCSLFPNFVMGGGRLTFDLTLTCYYLNCYPSAASRVDVTAGHTLTLTGPTPMSFYSKATTVGGDGTIVFTGEDADKDLTIQFYHGIRGQIDAKVATPNLTTAHVLKVNGFGTLALNNPLNEITGNLKALQSSAQYKVTVETPALGPKGQSGPCGSGSSILMQSAYLRYTGAGETMNRDIVSSAATASAGFNSEEMVFDQSGTGVWRIESPSLTTDSATPFLRLTGRATEPGVWAGVIPNGSATASLSLIKSETGTWRLEAANTYTGSTTIEAGVLELGPSASISSSSKLVLAGGNLKIDAAAEGTRAITVGEMTLSKNATIELDSNVQLVIAATNRTAGTLNILRQWPATVKITCLEAGEAPAWLTVNGVQAVVTADGTLNVPGLAEWKSATDGAWGDATRWTYAPSETLPALIAANGASYTVRVAADVATTNITVANGTAGETATLEVAKKLDASKGVVTLKAGATLKVVEGGEFYYNNACRHPSVADKNYQGTDLSVANGARFEVTGGSAMLTNVTGYADVGGTAGDEPAELMVSGGTFFYQPRTMSYGNYNCKGPLRIKAGGLFVMTNEATVTLQPGINGESPIEMRDGGETILTGSSKMSVLAGPPQEGGPSVIAPSYKTGTGTLILDGDASFKFENYGGPSFFCEPISGDASPVTRMYMRGRFAFDTLAHNFWVRGAAAKGRAYATFENEQTHAINYLATIGYQIGYGEMNVKSGTVKIGARGLLVGAATSGNTSVATGVVNVTGGRLNIESAGACNSGWGGGTHLMGVIVGSSGLRNGYNTSTPRTGARAGFGYLNLTGGALTNDYGNIVVGYGPVADGTILVDGAETVLESSPTVHKQGELCNTNSFVAVGAAGGLGRMIVSNGMVTVRNRVYVGGIVTNEFVNNLKMGWKLYDYTTGGFEQQIGTAKGTLTVAGGSFTAQHPIFVGSDGEGALEIGPRGVLSAPTLVLSNQTASVARFTFGADGVGQATVGRLVIASGAGLEVDISAYEGSKGSIRLLKADSVEGAFAHVTLTGREARPELRGASVVVDTSGIRCRIPRGTVLVVR